jgi:hypothetical protein
MDNQRLAEVDQVCSRKEQGMDMLSRQITTKGSYTWIGY